MQRPSQYLYHSGFVYITILDNYLLHQGKPPRITTIVAEIEMDTSLAIGYNELH